MEAKGTALARVGLLGGTFDPIHIGHLIIAEAARDQLRLDRVEFIPASDPPHKPDAAVSRAQHRLRMVEIAVSGSDHFVVNQCELDRPGPSFTADTLAQIQSARPGDVLHFVVGGDSLRDLPTWRDPERIVSLTRLAVIRRPGAEFDLAELERGIPGIQARTDFLDAPLIDIASRTLREAIRGGRSVRYLIPDLVIEYVESNALYR